MTFYLETPYSELYYNRDEAARDIADVFCDNADALAAFDACCGRLQEDGYTPEEIEARKEDSAALEEWATYMAYDMITDAEKNGCSALYGVVIYADAATEALEERINDMIDPWSAPESRVATFCDLYNASDLVSDIIEYIVNELDPAESLDEAAERVRLVDDIRAHRRARRDRVTR